MRPKLYPDQKPRSKREVFCRLCGEMMPVLKRPEHEESEPHAGRVAAYRREELLDAVIPYQCPGTVILFYAGAARLDNTLYDTSGRR